MIKCIDKLRRNFLWSGAEKAKSGHCLLAWPRVCRPPELGGLGIPDLQRFGFALRMRWLWLKRTDDHRSWFQLPAEVEGEVESMFQLNGAGEPEWLLEPAPRPATGVRSPALAPGRPSVTSPSEKKVLITLLPEFPVLLRTILIC